MSPIYDWFLHTLETEYESVRLLKESPRGSVRQIRHRASGKNFLLRRYTGSAEVYQKLLSVECVGLPKVYEVASRGEEHLVLEEYIVGDELSELMEGGLFTAEETKKIVSQVCLPLWALHSMGAVHRDVKPENIILRGDEAVLIDFDAARVHKPESATDTRILGTTGFAAPEQYGMGQSDARSDIYAVGVLMNVMLTGEHPSKHLAPGHLGRVVERCTRVNPKKRYQSVLRLMEEL